VEKPLPVQRTQSHQSAVAQPAVREEGSDGSSGTATPSYHPPPLVRPTSAGDPQQTRPLVQRKAPTPVASTVRTRNMYPISETNAPPTATPSPPPANVAVPPQLPPKIPLSLPGLVTSNLPGQPKQQIFSPSHIPLPDSALSSPSPSQIPLPQSAVYTDAPARAESLLRRAVIEQQAQRHIKDSSSPQSKRNSASLPARGGSVRSVDARGLAALEPVELPAGRYGDEDEEPVMMAVSYPGDEWVPRWDGD